MGDKSPKSVHRQALQKQTRTDAQNQKKQEAIIAKQNVFKKK